MTLINEGNVISQVPLPPSLFSSSSRGDAGVTPQSCRGMIYLIVQRNA
ncbi:MAG: hypothetical protein HXS52_05995 [Theionarchaea archaeon]|nr:hypothetical protein [Theionarchaea archaeon]